MTTVLHPRGNKVTVLLDPPKTHSEGGLELVNEVDDHQIGTVLEVGPGIVLRNARHMSAEGWAVVQGILTGQEYRCALRPIQPGDRVIFSKYAGTPATVGGKNIKILEDGEHNSEIIGVLEGEGE